MLTKHFVIVSEPSSLLAGKDSISLLLQLKIFGESLPLLMAESSYSSLIGMYYVSLILI
jgi:hypothetical protein